MKKYLGFSILIITLFHYNCKNEKRQELLSPQKEEKMAQSGWEKEYWSNQEDYSYTVSQFYNTKVLKISSDTLTASRWIKKIKVKPYAKYKISGYIKTEGVEGEKEQSGAGFRLGKFHFSNDTVFKGNTDWTYVEMEFETRDDDSFILECVLGKNGRAKGTVYFDNLKLEELFAQTLKPSVVIDIRKKEEPMSPYIYGQFIEHMGRSIYGGIWAEMLKDRKFYYKPGTKKSPWEINIDTNTISIDSSHVFSRGNIPVVAAKNGVIVLSQDSLTVEEGKNYKGRLVIKADEGIDELSISLLAENKKSIKTFQISSSQFEKIPFRLSTDFASKNAKLKIIFKGKGEITLAAVSLMPSNNIEGFRADVIELMKQLNSRIYRWPGGNFVSGYNWKDGIGDPDKRPTKYERAWGGLEYNDVGIHEFMKLCDILGAEAYIAVNTGLGTAEMAADEVEYLNGDLTTEMGKWRAENGHEEPYNVKFWAVGNEMFGEWQLGHMPVEDYVKKHNEVAKAMWEVDPDIALIAVGFPGNWNKMMYTYSSKYMSYISEHFYRQDWHGGGLLTHVNQIPDAIREIAKEHRKWRKKIPILKEKNIKIALDEWNYWYGPHVYGLLGTRYFLRDALGIAAGINELSRQSDIYYMANYAQTVNVIGAIKTTKTDAWLEGTGLVLKLYRNEFGIQPVAVAGTPEPLDIAASLTEDGKFLTISVINATHKEYTLNLNDLPEDLVPSGKSFIISGENDMVYNDAENKKRIRIVESDVQIKNKRIDIPKISAGIYKFILK